MFGFINDLIKKLNLKDDNFRLSFIDGKVVYVQNIKSVLKIDESEIALKIMDGEILISGTNLCINEFGENDITICGNITKIERWFYEVGSKIKINWR